MLSNIVRRVFGESRGWSRLAIALMGCHLLIAWSLHGGEGRSGDDFDRYWEISGYSGRADVSNQVEHAPLAPAYFKLIGFAAGSRDNFRHSLVWAGAVADIITACALAWAFGAPTAAVYAAVTLPLLPLYYMRFDLLPTMLTTIAVSAYRRNLPVTAAMALVAGVGFKLWPIPFCAWFARRWRDPVGRRATATFVALSALFGLGWLALGGTEAPGQVATFRGATGWQLESLIGGIIALWDLPSLRIEADAWRVGSISPTTTLTLLFLATAFAFWFMWSGAAGRDRVGVSWLASVIVLMLMAPLLSPQYLMWIAPATAIAWSEGHYRTSLLAAAAAALTVVLMRGYGALMTGQDWAVWLIIVRNFVLLLTLISAAVVIWRGRHPSRVNFESIRQ